MTGKDVGFGPEGNFGNIWVHAGALGSDGMTGGTASARLIISGQQMLDLIDFFDGEMEAIRGLAIIIEHGTVVADPGLRIEVPNFGRAWLMAHGMRQSPARRVAKLLGDVGFLVKTYSSAGAAGGSVAVVNGAMFGWTDNRAFEEAADKATMRGRRHLRVAGTGTEPAQEGASVQVSPDWAAASNRETQDPDPVDNHVWVNPAERDLTARESVDNPVWSSGDHTSNRGVDESRMDAGAPGDQTSKSLVSAIGQVATPGPSTGDTREEKEEEYSYGGDPDAGLALSRDALRLLLCNPEVGRSLAEMEARSVARLATVFARNLPTTTECVTQFRLATDDRPEVTLAWFAHGLLTVPIEEEQRTSDMLRSHFKRQKANFSTQGMQHRHLIVDTVVLLAALTDSTPKKWGGWVNWAMSKNHDWSKSTGVNALVEEIGHLTGFTLPAAADAPVVGPVPSSAAPAPAESADEPAAPAPVPAVSSAPSEALARAVTGGPLSPAQEERHKRGENYWQWFCDTVAPGTEFEDEASLMVVQRNLRMQDRMIRAYQRRMGLADPEF